MKQQLPLLEENKGEKKFNERSIRVNKVGHKEDGLMYNPLVHLDISQLKKHNSVGPMKKDTSDVDYKVLESNDMQRDDFLMIKPKICQENELQSSFKKAEEVANAKIQKEKPETSTKKVESPVRKFIRRFLDSTPIIVIMTSFTFFALFASDIQSAGLPTSVDFPFDTIQCFLLAAFALEIILASIVKEDYIWSFFFWLDVISTLSLLQDITFFFDNLLTGASSLSPPIIYENITITNTTSMSKMVTSSQQATSAISKVSSASRATRVLRIIRIIRLIRIVKLYKSALLARANMDKKKKEKERIKALKDAMESSSPNTMMSRSSIRVDSFLIPNAEPSSGQTGNLIDSPELLTLARLKGSQVGPKPRKSIVASKLIGEQNMKLNLITEDNENNKEKPNKTKQMTKMKTLMENVPMDQIVNESKISKVLSESITKKVIILIMAMLIILPILSEDFFQQDDNTVAYSLLAKYLDNYWHLYGISIFSFNETDLLGKILSNSVDPTFPIVAIKLDGQMIFKNSTWQQFAFRYSETKSSITSNGAVEITYSALADTTLTGILNICRTFFVGLLLAGAAVLFEQDTQNLVLEPLEIMMEIVESVAKDPINAKNVENLRNGVKQTMMKIGNKKKNKNGKKAADEMTEEQYEIKVIESAIIKISALLAIGFGDAGGEIIKENLSSNSELNAMLRGKKKTAIFGFCDIRNFPVVNEALQERTMVFVNEIAEIVHSSVDTFGGSANKNIGDAFLMVWKFQNDASNDEDGAAPTKIKDNLFEVDPANPIIQRTADMAVLGFLRVLIKINKDLRVLAYRNDADISKKLNNYRVKMGFGLHLGWAIEGAIGSSFKIDASYLSPNVNMAARLEAATKIYGVNILISGSLYDLLSDDLKAICRLIDIVTVKGSVEPMRLYTIDLNLNISPQDPSKLNKKESIRQKRQKYTKKKQKVLTESKLIGGVARYALTKNSFLEILNTGRGREFYAAWKQGLDCYFKGTWEESAKFFNECIRLVESDGPCNTLLGVLKANNYTAPKTWIGVRELTSKS